MADHDPSQFVSVLLRHQNELLRYALPLVACFDDAQDVLQEAATSMWKKYQEYDATRPFLPWAKQFVRNEVLMHHRRRRKYTFLTESLIESLLVAHDRPAELASQRRLALESCLTKLSESERKLVDRRYATQSVTIGQLAAESGQSANVLYKSLGRIRKQLLECINQSLATDAV